MARSSAIEEGGGALRPRFAVGTRSLKVRRETAAMSGLKRAHFTGHKRLAYMLLLPQLTILFFFFFVPSFRALIQAFQLSDPFGGSTQWVGFDNIVQLLNSAPYWAAVRATIVFAIALNVVTIGVALVFTFCVGHVTRGRDLFKTMILIPYAIAPAIAGVIWAFLFNPIVGPVAQVLHDIGIPWDPVRSSNDAMILIVLASAWKHICYNFIFLLAGLLAVPRAVMEAAAVDGAGPIRRFVSVAMPMLTPTLFFLIVINFVYGLVETFAVVDATTRGGPAGATTTLVYKVYQDGFVSLDLGSSAAESIILMVFALALTFAQFRFIERRVNYAV